MSFRNRKRTWKLRKRNARRKTTSQSRLSYDFLERRDLLAMLFWQGDVDSAWSTPGNWNTVQNNTGADQAPANGDILVFATNTTGFSNFTSNNDLIGLSDIEIEIVDDSAANSFNITGNLVQLTDLFQNGSSALSTIISMPLTLQGPTVISIISGNVNLNGEITNNGNLLEFDGVVEVNGILSGAGGVSIGGGSLALSSANTLTGMVDVNNNGTLLVTGSTSAASTINVNNGGTLGGNGNVQGVVNLNSGGTLDAGLSPGILMTGDLDMDAGSTFVVEIDGDGGTTPATAGAPLSTKYKSPAV